MLSGVLKPEWTVKYVAVSIIFLSSGLTLPTEVAIFTYNVMFEDEAFCIL